MLRKSENPYAVSAGVLSIGVHILLLALMFASFKWNTTPPASVAQVELWDNLPTPQPTHSKPTPPTPPMVKPKPIEPVKPVEPPKPIEEKPVEKEPPPDIALKKEKPPKPEPQKERKIEEKPKVEEKPKEETKKLKEDALKKLQQEMMDDFKPAIPNTKKQVGNTEGVQNSPDTQNRAGEVDAYKAKIRNKIRPYVNKQPCGSDNVEVIYKIAVIPTGEVTSAVLVKSSGIPACDDAVERAIHSASPLPVPADANLMEQFRNVTMPFYPNAKN